MNRVYAKLIQGKDWISVFLSASVVKVISLVRGLYVASILGPEVFGILNAIQMINQLNKYGAFGFNTIVGREVPYLEGKGSFAEANNVKNTAYTAEFILATILLVIGVTASFSFHERSIQTAVLLASIGLFFAKIAKMHRTESIVEKRFIDFAKINLNQEIIVTIIIVFTIHLLGMHSILMMTALGSLIAIFLFRRKVTYRHRFLIKKGELLRQIKIGFPLVLGTLSYGTYRYAERIIVLTFLGATELGYYALGSRVMDSILHIVLTRIKVKKIHISKLLGKGEYGEVSSSVYKETILFFVLVLLIVPLFAIVFDYMIPKYLEKYVQAIPILKLMVIASAVRTLGSFVSVVNISPLLNKQAYNAPLQMIAVIFIAIVSYVFHTMGVLTLYNFVVIDIIGYTVYHVSLIILYYFSFIRKHIVIQQ